MAGQEGQGQAAGQSMAGQHAGMGAPQMQPSQLQSLLQHFAGGEGMPSLQSLVGMPGGPVAQRPGGGQDFVNQQMTSQPPAMQGMSAMAGGARPMAAPAPTMAGAPMRPQMQGAMGPQMQGGMGGPKPMNGMMQQAQGDTRLKPMAGGMQGAMPGLMALQGR